jgi:hypothetical protein
MELQAVPQNTQNKPPGKKLLRWLVIVDILLLAVIAIFTLIQQPKDQSLDTAPALIVNGITITNKEYDDAIKYFQDFWGFDVASLDGQGEVKAMLIDRVILEQWAQSKGLTVSDDQILEKSKTLHENPPDFNKYPDFKAQAKAEILKGYLRDEKGQDYELWISEEVEKAEITDNVQ